MFGKRPSVIVWTSSKTNAAKAARELVEKQARMARDGYVLERSETVTAGRSKKSWLALGVLNFARGKQVQIVATFTLAGGAK